MVGVCFREVKRFNNLGKWIDFRNYIEVIEFLKFSLSS